MSIRQTFAAVLAVLAIDQNLAVFAFRAFPITISYHSYALSKLLVGR